MTVKFKKLAASLSLIALGMAAVFILANWDYFRLVFFPGADPYRYLAEQPAKNFEEILPANILLIPSLGIQAPISYPEKISEKEFQTYLQSGVAHYPGTALPGEAGNVYIFGHSSDYVWAKGDYKTIFSHLPKIEVGSSITLTNARGTPYTYIVKETKVVSPKDLSVLEQDRARHLLTLQTSYPLGTALKRYLVIAELKK